ncbi:MAG: type VI secretion system Vgr family protein [Chitinophagales bacterium]
MARQVNVKIELNGKSIRYFTKLRINQSLQWHHSFELQVPIDVIEGKNKTFINSSKNFIGKEIKVTIASKTNIGAPDSYFKGIITELYFSRRHGHVSDLVFKGHSPTILMAENTHSVSFTEKTLDQIVKKVTGLYPGNLIKATVKPKNSETIPYFVQYRESNFHFLSRIAAYYGEWFFYDGKDLFFGKPSSSDTVNLFLGRDLLSLDISLKAVPTTFMAKSRDYEKNKTHKSPSKSVSVPGLDQFGNFAMKESDSLYNREPLYETPRDIREKKKLDDYVKVKKSMQAADLVVFNGISNNPGVKIGSTATIKSKSSIKSILSQDDYGKYLIIGVSHVLDGKGNYENSFEALQSGLEYPPLNPYVSQPLCEAQTAIVKENIDPDKLGRIQVKFLWQDDPEKTPWIRIVNAHAGKDRGFFFRPEMEDEVLIGFEHNNPNYPYMMGALYHGEAKPKSGEWDNDKNDIKAIKTKSGNHIWIDDTSGKEEIKIYNRDETNIISLFMEGEGKIRIQSAGRIDMFAPDILIDASNSVTIKGGKTIHQETKDATFQADTTDMKSDSTMDIDVGQSTTLKSGTSLDIDGGAKTTLKTSATLDIDGGAKTTIKSKATLDINGGAKASVKAGILMLN